MQEAIQNVMTGTQKDVQTALKVKLKQAFEANKDNVRALDHTGVSQF